MVKEFNAKIGTTSGHKVQLKGRYKPRVGLLVKYREVGENKWRDGAIWKVDQGDYLYIVPPHALEDIMRITSQKAQKPPSVEDKIKVTISKKTRNLLKIYKSYLDVKTKGSFSYDDIIQNALKNDFKRISQGTKIFL